MPPSGLRAQRLTLILLALRASVALVTAIAPTAELWRTKRHPNSSWAGHQTLTEHIIHGKPFPFVAGLLGKRPGPRVVAYGLLFVAVVALGFYSVYLGSPTLTWRDIAAHYADVGGPDESKDRYDPALCAAFEHSLRLNRNAFARHPVILSGARSRIYLADEYDRHCPASQGTQAPGTS